MGKRAHDPDNEDQAEETPKKQRKLAENKKNNSNQREKRISGVPSTRRNGKAAAEKWSKDMLTQVASGQQRQIALIPARIGLTPNTVRILHYTQGRTCCLV